MGRQKSPALNAGGQGDCAIVAEPLQAAIVKPN
jgi:hypothetical protein